VALKAAGASWCALFPPSRKIEDLRMPFRSGVQRMHDALIAGGAQVVIADTFRPPQRAYLMHWSCMLAKSGQDPNAVPPFAGVDIDWTCGGNLAAAKKAAAEMVAGYQIAFPAALESRHTQGRAIDWRIILAPMPAKPYSFRDGAGKFWMFGSEDLDALYRFGATFGVLKLKTDPPHWSDDGH
jgi:D-alanyl-D-alanine dipeptidase